MIISDVISKFQELGIPLDTFAKETLNKIRSMGDMVDIEGLYNISTVSFENDVSKLVWSQPLKVVTLPVILHNAGINYFFMVDQSRFPFGGKVSLEINKGFIAEKLVEDNLLWNHLLLRKFPYILEFADVVKIVDLGSLWQHPDMCTFTIPTQLVFVKTKEPMDIAELKKGLKIKHDYINEPRSGPPLHNNEPVLRSITDIENRLDEILLNPDKSKEELYINDIFSISALSLVLDYIKLNGLPFENKENN